MEKDYNWTKDGDLVLEVIQKTWIPFARKHNMLYQHSSRENNKLHKFSFKKNDLLLVIMMTRTLPFECTYKSINNSSLESGGLHRLFEPFIPKGKSLPWFLGNNGIGLPNKKMNKKTAWLLGARNQIFLLEHYCSELIDTGDICGWFTKKNDGH